jgi:hypothetical protein
MGRHQREALPAEIQEARARLEAWRGTRKSGVALPEDIWSKAVAWAGQFGINPVCRALGLSYTDLKQRMRPVHQVHQVRQKPMARAVAVEPTFVELDRGCFQEGRHGGAVVELFSPDGARMVMRWAAGDAVDAGSLVASFLGRGR